VEVGAVEFHLPNLAQFDLHSVHKREASNAKQKKDFIIAKIQNMKN
jgi:hypothetical protein